MVFVNYGLPADYAKLSALGVSVKDRIALARYGRSHRAVKVHTAQEAGARALILYSDPADDGAAKGPVWPKGYWRGGDMLQRGNAKMSWFWHGDPLTPGVGATADAAALDPKTGAHAAEDSGRRDQRGRGAALLAALGGPERPAAFAAASTAPRASGPARRRSVAVDMDQGLRPIYNVVASLKGRASPSAHHARHASRRVDVRRRRSGHRRGGAA